MKRMTHECLNCDRHDECGVALLFAIGILSLLMVLGLAFVSNALIAQKIAGNTRSRSQARVLGQAAINRAAIAVIEYQLEVKNIHADSTTSDLLLTDLSTVVSHDASITDTNIQKDQLADKLKPSTAISALESLDSYRAPNWVYIQNGFSGTSVRVVGRIAYRILPPDSNTRMNLG